MTRGAGLLLSALAATTTAVVYDQPIDVTWVGRASNNNWALATTAGIAPSNAGAEGGWKICFLDFSTAKEKKKKRTMAEARIFV